MRTKSNLAKFGLFSFRPLVVVALLVVGLGSQPVFADHQQTVTFDNTQDHSTDAELDGQLPGGLIDWGSGGWWLAGPWQELSSNSVSFNGDAISSASFSFVSPRTLVGLDAYNGGDGAATVTLKCSGQADKTVQLAAGEIRTISTGWSGNTCSSVNVSTSNGWWTNFDNFVLAS